MGSGVPTTHLSSHLFSTTTTSTTRSKHHCLSQLAATSHTDKSSTKQGATKKCVEKQKMPGRPWGKMTTMQGGVKRAATSIRFAFRGNRSNHTVVSARRKFSCLEKSILFLSPFASCVLLIFFVQDINVKQVLQVRGEMCLQRASALVTQRRRPVCCLVPPPFVYLFIIQWDLKIPAFVRQNMFKQCLYVPFIRVYCQI